MRTSLTALCMTVCLAVISFAGWQSALRPGWNLDGIFYAVLVQPSSLPLTTRHEVAYASTDSLAPTDAREALEHGSPYRRSLRDDVEVFALQLPFYTNKPLYVWLGKLAVAAGAAIARAPYVVSALSFVLIGVSLAVLALSLGARPPWIAASAALVLLTPPMRELASLAAPDGLSTLLLVAGATVALRSTFWAALPLMAASMARPDAAILALGILLACWTREPSRSRALGVVATAAVICIVALLVPVLTGSYGWVNLMRHTFIHRSVQAADFNQGFGFHDYLDALAKGLRGHDVSRRARFEPYLALAAISCWVCLKTERAPHARAALHLVVGIWIATALRFLAFPAFGDRHFSAAYVISVAVASAVLPSLRFGRLAPVSDGKNAQ
jgi:hypothetical protein